MLRVITDGRFGNDDDGSITPGSKFRIKIRQIDCTSSDERIQSLRAPEGCLQYFTERLHDNFVLLLPNSTPILYVCNCENSSLFS